MLQRSKACWKRSRLYPQQFPFYDVKKYSVHSVTAECFEWKWNYTLRSCCGHVEPSYCQTFSFSTKTSLQWLWQTVISREVGMKCWRGQSIIVNADFLAVPLTKPHYGRPPTPTPPALAPCLEFKQLFCFVEVASGCLFSFLSFYFLPFFRRHLKLQRLKGMADGWSNRHSAAQWTPAASRATAHREEAGPWMKRWVWVLWRARGEVRRGGLNMHSQICIWI